MVSDGSAPFPFGSHDLADARSLSIVYTNRVLGQIIHAGQAEVSGRRLRMLDLFSFSTVAQIIMDKEDVRPIL